MLKRTLFILGLIILIFTGIASSNEKGGSKVITLEKKEATEVKADLSKENPIRIAVGGMITPREGFVYYKKLLTYIEEKLGRQVKYVDRENYAEINELLKSGVIDVAFVCSGPYVDGHREFGLQLLVAPVAYGETVYYSYIIVSKDSPINSFKELQGKIFAFTDPLSNTGRLVPTYMLAKMNETPPSFFKKYIFTYAHDKSIEAVAQRVVDGAAVDSLIWEYANRVDPKFTSKTKIIEKSPPYGIPPVVVRSGLEPELVGKIKGIFLNTHKDAKGKAILEGMMIDKFVEIECSAYDSIREMKDWISKQKAKKNLQSEIQNPK